MRFPQPHRRIPSLRVHDMAQLVTIQGVINLNDIDGEIERILSSVTV